MSKIFAEDLANREIASAKSIVMGTIGGLLFVFCTASVFVMALVWTGSFMWASLVTYGLLLIMAVLWVGSTVRDAVQANQRSTIKALAAIHAGTMGVGQEINTLRREVAPRR